MNTFKNNIKGNFTTIPNNLVNDESLSWKAKGIFLYLASKPNDWQFYMSEIANNATDGRTALQSGIKELEDGGYLTRKRLHGDDGSIERWEWVLTTKQITHQTENPPDGKPTCKETLSYSNSDNTNKEGTNIDYIYWIDLWNDLHDCSLRVTESKRKQIRARLKTFSEDEIEKSMRNRAKDEWLNTDGEKYLDNWDSFWRNDEKVERYLVKEVEQSTDIYSGTY